MIDDEKQSFIDTYRDYMEQQRDKDFQNLDVARKNDFTNIMSGANKLGMMYSNFPERAKYQYDTSTYDPGRIKIQQTYQTGLDALQSNLVKYVNQLAEINESTNELNQASKVPLGATAINDLGDYRYEDIHGVTQYRDANNDNIRFGHAAQNAGYSNDDDILLYAKNTLTPDEYSRLKKIWDAQKENGNASLQYNWGDNWQLPAYEWLSPEDNDFLGSLGLSFGF